MNRIVKAFIILFIGIATLRAAAIRSGSSGKIGVSSLTDGGDSSVSHITFTSTPVRTGIINQPYEYDPAVTTTPPGLKVCFHLGEDAPDGMTINDTTGVVQWIPASPGMFEVEIRARVCDSSWEGRGQEYLLTVFSAPPGSVNGTVKDDLGTALRGIVIKLFDVSGDEFILRAHTDSTGKYEFPAVNPASYLVRARPPDGSIYLPQWFDGASSMDHATPVVVNSNAESAADFTLHKRDTSHYTISGTVMDNASHPIKGARLFITRVGHDSLNDDEGFGGWEDWRSSWEEWWGIYTDSNGNYSGRFRSGTYIAAAFKQGFLPQFWDHKTDPLEADQIHLTANTPGIDFNLNPRVAGTGSISGTIKSAADSSGQESHVVGFQEDGTGHFTGFKGYTRSDGTGHYALTGLPDGDYIVLAKSEDDFIPTFYNASGGTPFLDSAASVHSSGGSVTGVDIFMRPDSEEGLNSMAGVIQSASSGGSAAPSSLMPVGGAIVTIVNADNVPVSSAISLSDGSYLAPGLAAGRYQVVFQKAGLASASVPASVSYANNSPTTTTVNAQMVSGSGGSGGVGVMSVSSLWNLVSVPVEVSDRHRSALFPTSSSAAFGFNGASYVPADILNYTSGYWLRFPAAQVLAIAGAARTSQTIQLNAGWNLIGSLSGSISTPEITTSPAGIISGHYFTYAGGYAIASTIDPGKGYWVKAAGSGSLTLNAGSAAPKGTPPAGSALAGLNSITITDAAGNSQTLYFGPAAKGIDQSAYQLPPLPPAEAFDVRFGSQRLIELYSGAAYRGSEYPIALQAAVQPLTVSWSIHTSDAVYKLNDGTGAVAVRMTGTGTVRVGSAPTRLTLGVEPLQVPKSFGLYQNYPNPFNPSTTIAFDLPVSASVTLKVYNVLGQQVATVLDGVPYEAGRQSARFDASSLTTGVYFYRIHAGSFVSVRKMVLVK